MRVSNWTNPQFVDATSVGGLNAAFGTASGSMSSMGMAAWAQPGLLFPETMSLSFAGLVGSAGLPSPWGVVSSGGIVVRAHGTQTGQDTTSYSVDFTSLVPSSGSVTAYLAAMVTTIQQNPFPLTGPPQGHPSFNPNFVPGTAYATTTYSVALTAVTGTVDNTTVFELARVTLVPGQSTIASYSTLGWRRAPPLAPVPATVLASGGALTLAQTAATILPGVSGLTSTLPLAVSGGGLSYHLVNPSAGTVWTVAAGTGNTLAGTAGTPVASVGIPPYGAMTLWGNAASGQWEVTSVNPLMLAALPNVFTAPQSIIDSSTAALTISGSGSNGANLRLSGNGAVTPNKYLRVFNGNFSVVNSLYTASLLNLDDVGNMAINGFMSANSLTTAAAATIGNGLTVTAGGIYATGLDSGGMQIRMAQGANAGAGFRNDGSSFYLLMSNTGSPTGGFNGLRPLTISLANGAITMDGTGAGVVFGGVVAVPNIGATIGNIGGVAFPGGGVISTNGAISSNSQVFGNTVATNGNIVAGARLRAVLGAYQSGDPNAGVILNDFVRSVAANYIYEKFPDGTIIQAYFGASVTGADTITFPNAFPNICVEVIPCEGNPIGWITSGGSATVFGTALLTAGNFVLYVNRYINGATTWNLSGGIAYRYIAIGF